ncbi:anaphase-promoting complex subunit 1 isoform X2 [Phalaenopsis equestris]|uniref:anaphase-promoting complex subunit 1 isoform X2 n=1 Tax=Phalaenopsis equestris TaxID=78828 RepID=UPI0009E47D2A|nr:anaphase-promoting complex subunit 1 isoform X2 [Phalaenopsis equestris]
MSIGVRQLTVLREFKPFGLTAEEQDGKPAADVSEKYAYFLFGSEVTRERDDLLPIDSDFSSTGSPFDCGDQELFIRGNRIIWSKGFEVHKRYSSSNNIVTACWCRMDAFPDALLCVLEINNLSVYYVSGEVICIPLPYTITNIWPTPFGLLLQKSTDEHRSVKTSSSIVYARDTGRAPKDYRSRRYTANQHNYLEPIVKEVGASLSSHLILKHPMGELQATYIEERGKLTVMKDYEERTIWTSDVIPLMTSYNKDRLQHSVWLVEAADNCNNVDAGTLTEQSPSDFCPQKFSLRRIWQGKCSQFAASKVFFATDSDGVPIICFLLQEQKLLSVRLQIDEGGDGVSIDVRPLMIWSIPAISAATVTVTRPRVKVGRLTFMDIIVLDCEGSLLLYTGDQCLCKYILPVGVGSGPIPVDDNSSRLSNLSYGIKIVGIDDAVEGRFNITLNSGRIFRCTLHCSPSSSLANDCLMAMAEGLHSSSYSHFLRVLWGSGFSASSQNNESNVESQWESFLSTVHRIIDLHQSSRHSFPKIPSTSWDFLISSKFHTSYGKQVPNSCISVVNVSGCRDSLSAAVHVPDKRSPEVIYYRQLSSEMLDSLHALYENLKLNNLRKQDLWKLVVLLCKIAASLGEASYVDYYVRDFPCVLSDIYFFQRTVTQRAPPSLFHWLETCLRRGCHLADLNYLPSLIFKGNSNALCWARKVVCFYSLLLGAERNGKKLSTGVYYDIAKGTAQTPEELTVLAMVAERFGHPQLDLLPVGVSLPLHHALDKCRDSPPSDWPAAAYVLVGREDLAMASLKPFNQQENIQNNVNLTSFSPAYRLHLRPVTVPSFVSENTRVGITKVEDADATKSVEDGMEHIFNSNTQLRFGRDLRLNEVRRLLCSARPVAIQTPASPTATDQDFQQHQLWNLAQRTTALPFGRGAFTLATTYTLLTEALFVPKLILAGRLPSQQNATVNLDPNLRSISELKSWPEFHNGVAAGLKLAPFQGKMSRTWILYNKPQEPNFSHAGLLLALGLHEHLRVLMISDVYRYLAQEHDITTCALLLGLSASSRGTMDPAISKILLVHIPARHPSNFPELELPTVLQSAALMGIGLLYEGSAHPLTTKILLGEIGRRSGGDNVLEREGYAVAAGCALGLVALGRGSDAFSFMDASIDQLFQYIGSKGVNSEKSFHIGPSSDDQSRSIGQMLEGTHINVDVTAPGATIALALIFLKTESEVVASRLHIPTSHFELQYLRPDFIMLRIIARSLIMWSRICPSKGWVDSLVPAVVNVGIVRLTNETNDNDEFDRQALVQAYVNIVTGACISIGLKYAGTRNGDAQELLYNYAIYFLSEIKYVSHSSKTDLPKGLLHHVDRGTLEISLHLVILSLCVVMAGSGHLQTFRLLRYLRSRSSVDGHMSYGIQMGISLAIGFLFLGGGVRTFSTRDSAVAALLIALYPRLPTGPNDNRCHLQAFRHLYVIAAESRWLQTVDVDTGLPVYSSLEVTVLETDQFSETSYSEVTPCILPERSTLKNVRVCGPRYWPQVIDFLHEGKSWLNYAVKSYPLNGGLLYVKRKVGFCSYVDDPIGCQSLLSRAMHKVFDKPSLNNSSSRFRDECKPGSNKVGQLVGTFSADPSLIAFAEVCCESSWNNGDDNFQEFCSQVIFECVSNDRPALLPIYLSLYTTIASMWEQVKDGRIVFHDLSFLQSLKLALAYNEALKSGKLSTTRGGGIIQSTFLESIKKHVEGILSSSSGLRDCLIKYMNLENWPHNLSGFHEQEAIPFFWYLQWYSLPPPHVVKEAAQKIRARVPSSSSMLPLLRLLLPNTHIKAISQIDELLLSSGSK